MKYLDEDIIGQKSLEKEIISILDEDPVNEDVIIDKLKNLEKNNDESTYVRLLKILTHLDFSSHEAKKVWDEIILHKKDLSAKMGRELGFRVAMLDYFIHSNKQIKNPKIIEIKLYIEKEKLILIDALTGLYNRRYFSYALDREMKQASRYKRPLSLIIVDIDNFKQINDQYGHPKGDWVLAQMGAILHEIIRSEDSACRIGGEEFAIILPETNEEQAQIVANKMRIRFAQLMIEANPLTLSGGVASFPSDSATKEALISTADKHLYYAKYSGKNKILSKMDERRISRREISRIELSLKLADDQIDGISNDISISGISFKVSKELEIGTTPFMLIHNQSNQEQQMVQIEVVWVKQDPIDNMFNIGARFLSNPDKRE